MKKSTFLSLTKHLFIFFTLFFYENVIAQYSQMPEPRNPFWEKVQFGGGLGLNFGSGYTDISVAPSAIYNINQLSYQFNFCKLVPLNTDLWINLKGKTY